MTHLNNHNMMGGYQQMGGMPNYDNNAMRTSMTTSMSKSKAGFGN